MGLRSRRKGKAFELVVRSRFVDHFPGVTIRRSSQAERAYEADLIIESPTCPAWLSALWVECEHADATNPLAKLEQGERDAMDYFKRMSRSRYPIACTRETGRRAILATMRAHTLTELVGAVVSWPGGSGGVLPVTVPLDDLLAALKPRCRG